jgi:diamine N-acetyltransferase
MKIVGEKVVLVPIDDSGKDEFFDRATNSYGADFWYDKEEKERRSKEDFMKDWKGHFCDDDEKKGRVFWILIDEERIGAISYSDWDPFRKKAEIDIIIFDEQNTGKGYGPEAMKVFINYLFEKFELNKVWLDAREGNGRALKAYEKVGFKREGLLREADYYNGKFENIVRMGLLKREFKF